MKKEDAQKVMLHDALGIDHDMEITVPNRERKEIEPIKEDPLSEDAENDYQTSRTTLKGLIEVGNKAVVDLADLAEAGQYPRAYEVLATLIKTVGETTNSLYDIHKKTKELKGGVAGKKILDTGDGINIDKAVFCGTTSDLLKMIKKEDRDNNG
jgi:hypothetical protein